MRLFATIATTIALAGGCSREEAPTPQPKTAQPKSSNADPSYGLRPGPGREHVIGNCLPCHSGAIIASNHLSRAGWDEVITLMQKKNGMHELTPKVRSAILGYLETAQRPDDPGLAQGKKSPWANPLYRPNPIWR